MDHKSPAMLLALVGIALIFGAVHMVKSPLTISVQKPYSQAAPSVQKMRINYPNGGQTFKAGGSMAIVVSGCDQPVFYFADRFKKTLTASPVSENRRSSTGALQSGEKTITAEVPASLAPGAYYVLGICRAQDKSVQSFDYSNDTITLSSSSQPAKIFNVLPSDTAIYVSNGLMAQWNSVGIYHANVSLLRKNAQGSFESIKIMPFTERGSGGDMYDPANSEWPAIRQHEGQGRSAGSMTSYRSMPIASLVSSGDYGKALFKIRIVGFDATGKGVVIAESEKPFSVR